MSRMKIFAAALGLTTMLASTAAFAGDAESCKKVRLSDVGWTDIQATTGVASTLLTALGYEPEVIQLSVPVTYASLKNKDLDVFLGNWMPSMTNDIKDYTAEGSVETISTNLEGAGYGIVVPTYVADAGVRTLTDLGKFKDKFDGKIYGIEAGNDGNRIILDMISKPENNLEGFELVESSEAGMLTQAEQSMQSPAFGSRGAPLAPAACARASATAPTRGARSSTASRRRSSATAGSSVTSRSPRRPTGRCSTRAA